MKWTFVTLLVRIGQIIDLVLSVHASLDKQQQSQSDYSLIEVWASFLEQGLIGLAELIQQGTVVNSMSASSTTTEESSQSQTQTTNTVIFPERQFRQQCTRILHVLSHLLESNANIRNRIASALIYTRNSKLRVNILSGILILVERSASLRR